MNIKGKVLPVTNQSSNVYAKTKSGKKLAGQVKVSYPEQNERIDKLWLEPKAQIYEDAKEKIKEADLIVICPGDLYGSILPNFLVQGMGQALKKSKAEVVYVCNLVTKQGTYGFKASDFVQEINKYTGTEIDYAIINTKEPSQEVVDKYEEEESFFVKPDIEGENVIKENLLQEHQSNSKTIARHNSKKLAKIIMHLI